MFITRRKPRKDSVSPRHPYRACFWNCGKSYLPLDALGMPLTLYGALPSDQTSAVTDLHPYCHPPGCCRCSRHHLLSGYLRLLSGCHLQTDCPCRYRLEYLMRW